MQEISSLNDLVKVVGDEKVDMLFTEYMMQMVAKANLLDSISSCVESGGNLKDIKEILNGENL